MNSTNIQFVLSIYQIGVASLGAFKSFEKTGQKFCLPENQKSGTSKQNTFNQWQNGDDNFNVDEYVNADVDDDVDADLDADVQVEG